MEFPKDVMKISELQKMGFSKEYLMKIHRNPKQNFSHKLDSTKRNSPIVFHTKGLEKWILKEIKTQVQAMPRGG